MARTFLVRVGLLLSLAALAPRSASAEPFEQGREAYAGCRLAEAESLFTLAQAARPDDPLILDYLAETRRRLGRQSDAVELARRVLKRRPCDSWAHEIVSEASNPQFSDWSEASSDTAYSHLRTAVACDPNDGNAWLGLWTHAIRLRDDALARRCLERMVSTGLLAPPLLAYTRWELRALPDSAILITNGDMDTYPAIALQVTERLRTDVAVVCSSLLDAEYVDVYLAQLGVPKPVEEGPLRTYYEGDRLLLAGREMVRRWLVRNWDGRLSRPVVLALTLNDTDFGPDSACRMICRGPYWSTGPVDSGRAPADTTAIRTALMTLRAQDFAGSWVGVGERSPVRLEANDRLRMNPIRIGMLWAWALGETGRTSEARDVLRWMDDYARSSGCPPEVLERLRAIKARIED